MRVTDIELRPFTYNYHTFTTYSNPHRVIVSNITIVQPKNYAIISLLIVLYSRPQT